MAKGKSSRLDFVTLDTAHKRFMVLAREESRPEVRRALDQAAHITATSRPRAICNCFSISLRAVHGGGDDCHPRPPAKSGPGAH
jgi:hypothetical protein